MAGLGVIQVTRPTGDGAYPDCGPWAFRRRPRTVFLRLAQPLGWAFFAPSKYFQSQAPIYAAMLILNGLWVWEARMSEWGEWWADVKVMIWWMAISVVSGELLALAMREIGF